MDIYETTYFSSRDDWRKWLTKNHDTAAGIWVGYYKKNTDKPTITILEGVEEALCFGWINTTVRSIDAERYIQKYLPRKNDHLWSKVNKDAAKRMIKAGKMTAAGLAKIEAAKKTGAWQAAYTSKKRMPVPTDLRVALAKSPIAKQHFARFANSYNNMYIGWILDAKTEDTRHKRILQVVDNATRNVKQLGTTS